MRKRIFIQKMIIFLMLLAASPASAAETFTFATHARPPVSHFLRELLTEAFLSYNKNVTLKEMPGRRVIQMVNDGVVDGDACRVRKFKQISNDDTSNYVRVDEPVVLIKIVMLTHKDTRVEKVGYPAVNQGKTLFLRGSKKIRKNIETPNRQPIDDLKKGLELLKLKRYRSMVLFKSEAELAFRKDPDLKQYLVIQEPEITAYNMYVYLHRKHADLAPKLRQSFKKLKTNGRFKQIADNNFVSMPVIGKD